MRPLAAPLLWALLLCAPSVSADDAPQSEFVRSGSTEIILDLSSSMIRPVRGEPQYQIAKQALATLVSRHRIFGSIRVYGHRYSADDRERSCADSEVVVPLALLEPKRVRTALDPLRPRGLTALSYALEQAAVELRRRPGRKRIVLMSDGAESCGGDVAGIVELLTHEGIPVQLNTIAFNGDDEAVRQLGQLARKLGGVGQVAHNLSELVQSFEGALGLAPLNRSLQISEQLLRTGEDAPTVIDPGIHRITVSNGARRTLRFLCAPREKFKISFTAPSPGKGAFTVTSDQGQEIVSVDGDLTMLTSDVFEVPAGSAQCTVAISVAKEVQGREFSLELRRMVGF